MYNLILCVIVLIFFLFPQNLILAGSPENNFTDEQWQETSKYHNLDNPIYKILSLEEDIVMDNLFEQLLTESKLFYADAIISDLKGDSLKTLYYFDIAFKKPLNPFPVIAEQQNIGQSV